MEAGRLRHRVDLETRTEAADAHGQMIATWAVAAKVWASVEPLSGRELMRAQQIQAEATVRVRMRFRSDLTTDARLVWEDGAGVEHTLEVLALIDVGGRGRELELLCAEILA